MQRRDFIQLAGLAALSDTQRIRIGMLGTQHSHASGKLKAILDSPDYELAGVCEPDAAARDQRRNAAPYKNVRWMSAEEMLNDPSIRMLAVETAVPDLIQWGRKTIAAGKHLHLEKPPTNQMPPFRELIEEAERKRLLVQVGYIWRFHEGFAAIKQAMRQGWLGSVYMLRGVINTDIGPEARAAVGRYRGGMMFELGCHVIDRVVDLWGRPKAVRSWLLPDNALAVFEYDQGLAVVSSAARMPGHSAHRTFEAIGSDGAMVIQPIEPGNKMRVSMRTARGPYKAGWQEIEMRSQPRYSGDFQDFARALRAGQPLTYSYAHELLVHEALLRASGELTG